jgi:hypothetical protein
VLDADEVTGVDEAVGIDDTTSSEDVPSVSEAIFGDGATKGNPTAGGEGAVGATNAMVDGLVGLGELVDGDEGLSLEPVPWSVPGTEAAGFDGAGLAKAAGVELITGLDDVAVVDESTSGTTLACGITFMGVSWKARVEQ